MSLSGPIICIEDDKDDQLLIAEAIKELQILNEVCFFFDGEAALEFLKSTPKKPFLILCDTNLPLINGIELRKRLNENEYLRRKSIPFVFITTSANPALVQIAYDITVQGYFKKPYTYIELKRQIKLIIAYWSECLHPTSEV
ncbi:response regulator [Spirosoma endbachense]|uniref:Response regulator n=1 Tax=Spirosoma endbachense TaxID=2666025 RepID=A0A6P1WAD6_9BACT|nr:response regulator [Spirosoma endbachense]QHW01008.1 response regulator [Spirosoma endbachense]